MVEGAVGLGAGFGGWGDSRRVVAAGRAPPSAVSAATSPSLRDREENGGGFNSLSYTCPVMPYSQMAL